MITTTHQDETDQETGDDLVIVMSDEEVETEAIVQGEMIPETVIAEDVMDLLTQRNVREMTVGKHPQEKSRDPSHER